MKARAMRLCCVASKASMWQMQRLQLSIKKEVLYVEPSWPLMGCCTIVLGIRGRIGGSLSYSQF